MNARILIIDDDRTTRVRLRQILKDEYEVEEATNGLDGLAQARASHFDVIMTDLDMPVMNGTEFLLRVMQEAPSSKVIAMSGSFASNTSQGFLPTAMMLGAVGTLPKPLALAQVLQTVHDVLRNATTEVSQAS